MTYASGWYPLARSSDVGDRPLPVDAFGLMLVLWRGREGLIGMIDRCPHRSARLSGGHIVDGAIVCPFHGLRFGADGSCSLAPEIKRGLPSVRAQTFAVAEQDGIVWAHFSLDETPTVGPPKLPLDKTVVGIREDVLNVHITRAIENQLDHAHLPFVHRATIGRNVQPDQSFRHAHRRDALMGFVGDRTDAIYTFTMPSVFILPVLPKLVSLVLFCPIDNARTRAFLITGQSFVTIPGLSALLTAISLRFNRRILDEDRRVIEGHPPGSSLVTGTDEHLGGSDDVIKAFRELWRSRLAATADTPLTRLSSLRPVTGMSRAPSGDRRDDVRADY